MCLGIFADEFCRHVVHLLAGLHPRHQLRIAHTHQVGTFIGGHDAIRNHLVARLVFIHRSKFALWFQIGIQSRSGHDGADFLTAIGVESLHADIVNLRSHAQGRIRRQCPGRGGPCQEHWCAPLSHLGPRIHNAELRRDGGVFHVTIATGLVQFVARKSRSGSRRIRLNGISLVEQTFVIELLQEPPQCFDILIVVSDIGMVKVYEIAHFLRQVAPFLREHHHIVAASGVIVLNGDISGRCGIVDISLGNAFFLLHTQFHGQSVCVPAGLTVHLEALHCLITVESILECTPENMVNAGMTVSRRRTFEENKLWITVTLSNGTVENIILFPLFQNLIVDLCQVKTIMFSKHLCHNTILFFLNITTLFLYRAQR